MVTQTNDGGKGALALLENAEQCCSIEECTEAGVCFPGNGAADLQVDFTEGQEIHASAASNAQRCWLRHIKIRERQSPSLGVIQHTSPYRPCASQIEVRSQEETLGQEQCARRHALDLAKGVLKLNEKDEATCFSPPVDWWLPAPSNSKTKRKRMCIALWSFDAHAEQEGPELC